MEQQSRQSDTRVAWWLRSPKRPSKVHLLPHPGAHYARCGVYVRGKGASPAPEELALCSRCEKNAEETR